ncbi:MAG: nucleotidyltransferase domain-containing protein [Planctomycetaceae bacterium]
MTTKSKTPVLPTLIKTGSNISLRAVRRYAQQIAERYRPDEIILFGSYAYGTPHADSDVDLLVIMPCRNELDMSVKITWELPAPFPMDLLVRKPAEWEWRIREKESFATEIRTKGKSLYAKGDARMGQESGVRLSRRRRPANRVQTVGR